ncbi:hypothetical protein ATO11_14840 [Pseudaestuariivita atlantica]|uniref:Uncharacterized protein n=1 Tax=Pseudaestuariivita atlantica TaxID=1317121 RepID=A0A0L1JLX2_9RHOB|nr:hypothetical protein ATO11_14840 [Pseudaestuariivita atlantica]
MDFPQLLDVSRKSIALNLDFVELVSNDEDDFLEGMHIRDEAFEEWLHLSRSSRKGLLPATARLETQFAPPAQSPKAIAITNKVSGEGGFGQLEWLGSLMTDNVARHLREAFSVEVITGDQPVIHENLWHVEIETCRFSASSVGVRMALSRPSRGLHIWADRTTVEMQGAPPSDHPDIALLSNRLVDALGDELLLGRDPETDCPDSICRRAIRSMFAIQSDAVLSADKMFERAFQIKARGLYLAWRAQAKTIMKIERHGYDEQALKDEAESLCARALEIEPNNSMVLATVANTFCLTLRSYDRSMFLAKRSVQLNPQNPMAWFALSSANMHAGNSKEALKYTLKANQLASTSPHRFWWDSQVFAAALSTGKFSEAEYFAESCRLQNPDFRPPLRYLIALHARAGRQEDALRMVEQLKAIEPGFTVDRLVKDREYPAALLHQNDQFDLSKIAELA